MKALRAQVLACVTCFLVHHQGEEFLVFTSLDQATVLPHKGKLETFMLALMTAELSSHAKETKLRRQALQKEINQAPSRKGGRTATYKRPEFALIPQELLKFAQTHDFLAQAKRRTNTAEASGITLQEAREHLFKRIPGLQEFGFSRDSVHRLMMAPSKGTSCQ